MSTELFFPTARSQRWLRTGPLIHDLDGFAAHLATERYARVTIRDKLRLVRNLSRWLEREGLGIDALDEQRFEDFLLARRRNSRSNGEATTGRQLLNFLRESGRAPAAVPTASGGDHPVEQIAGTYGHFLINERGLYPATARRYQLIVQAFLTEHFTTRAVVLQTLAATSSLCRLFSPSISRHGRWSFGRSPPRMPTGSFCVTPGA